MVKRFIVLTPFIDSKDKTKAWPTGRRYNQNDFYPSTKRKVPPERIVELLGENVYNTTFIKEVDL